MACRFYRVKREANLAPEGGQGGGVAGPVAADGRTGSKHKLPHTQVAAELGDEFAGGERAKCVVEIDRHDHVETRIRKHRQAFFERLYIQDLPVGLEQCPWLLLEHDGDRRSSAPASGRARVGGHPPFVRLQIAQPPHLGQELPVADVHTVERADGHRGRPARRMRSQLRFETQGSVRCR
jgi:hypothetical protein